ncbi:MAG: hypothetical protein HY744_24625 [Deltaproteobacteria bacterium]|nr:hypothetical protein [Deltaproteobacteria bacterium]
MDRRTAAVLAGLALAACSGPDGNGPAPVPTTTAPAPGTVTVSLLFTGGVAGYLEPCG